MTIITEKCFNLQETMNNINIANFCFNTFKQCLPDNIIYISSFIRQAGAVICQKQISVEGDGHCCHRPSSNWETISSVATPRVFSPDLGFSDPIQGSGFFLEDLGFSWGFSKNLGFFWGFVRFPRKIHILECFLLVFGEKVWNELLFSQFLAR